MDSLGVSPEPGNLPNSGYGPQTAMFLLCVPDLLAMADWTRGGHLTQAKPIDVLPQESDP